jgi:hypothetical protein
MEEAAILAGISKVRSVPNSHEKRTPEDSAQGLKMTIREIDGIPVCVGQERIARYRRGKRPKPPMAELGIEKLKPQQKLALRNKFELGMSNRQATVQAGYAETSASSVLPRLLQRKPIQDALIARGITDFKIAEVIAEGLEQSVTKGIVSAKRKWNGITLKYRRKSPDVSPWMEWVPTESDMRSMRGRIPRT